MTNLFMRRATALKEASKRANDPSFKVLWARKLEQLVNNERIRVGEGAESFTENNDTV